MSLSVSSLTSDSTAGASVGGFTTASITPAANSMLILAAGGFDGTGSQDFTISSVSGLGLTWTRRKLGVAGSGAKGDVEAWTAVCGGSPGSGTITAATSIAFSGGMVWDVDQVTGQDGTTPIVASNIQAANASSTAAALTFNAAANSSNLYWFMSVALLGGGGSVSQTPSETPAWTSLSNLQSSTATYNGVGLTTQISPDVTHTAAGATLSVSHSWGTIGLEIAASLVAPSTPRLLMASYI
jgi:hypothetical protein